jgi:hypothetical protein
MAVLAPRSSHLRGTYGSVRHPNKKGDRSLRSPSFAMVTAYYPIQSFNCHSFNRAPRGILAGSSLVRNGGRP